jgi:Uncharacterised nucleotidyltransferase
MIGERPEVALLLECAARRVAPDTAVPIASAVRGAIDWTYLLELARAHGVTPLVYRSLRAAYADVVPAEILEELESRFYSNAGRNLFLAQQLVEILHLLDSRGVAAIPYKGPAFSVTAYGDLISREFGDLDILVREPDYEHAQRLISTLGYRSAAEFEWESTFVHESGMCAVDLHKRVTPRGFSCPLDFESLSRRLESVELCGRSVRTLCAADALLMLAIQITKDTGTDYFQLGKVCDLAMSMRTQRDLDEAQFLLEARRLRSERIVLFSLRLANDLLGVPISPEISERMRSHPPVERLAEYAGHQLFDRDGAAAHHLTTDTFNWEVREDMRDKLYPYYYRYVVQPMQPSDLDRGFMRLPAAFSFLYYFLRPLRLVGKYVFRRDS